MQKLFDLSGRVVWVVGSGYFGAEICRATAEHGATLVVSDVQPEVAERICDRLTSAGHSAHPLPLDVSDEEAVGKAVDEIVERHGQLDVAINTTLYSTGKPMMEMSLEDWQSGLKVTLGSAFVIAREAGRIMIPQEGGSIIQFGSMYGEVSPDPRIYAPKWNVNPIDYGAAKAGIEQLVRYQAVMWAPHRVRVNAVVPGPFPHPGGQGDDETFVQRLCDKVPMGRIGRPSEIAGAVVFLASEASSFVTGTRIVVDGGWTAW